MRSKKRKRDSPGPGETNGISPPLLSPPKKRHVSLVGGDPLAPTEKEWEQMGGFSKFVVPDGDGQAYHFPTKKYALILPDSARPKVPIPLRDYWVGKIKDIRSRNNDPADVWVKVQWLWSIQELLKEKKNIDPTPFGDMERVLSSHFDFVSAMCFDDITDVEAYVESDPEPPAISDKTFYYRSTYEIHSDMIKSIPKPTCFCDKAYNANEAGIMHFCPRKGCCRAFHANCLARDGFVEKSQKDLRALRAQRGLQLERTLPSASDEEEDERGSSSPISNSITLSVPNSNRYPETETDRHHEIPPELLVLARSPMVKGNGTGLPHEWSCVTGNLALVTRARKLVHDALESKNSRLPLKWRTLLEIPGEESMNDENIDASKVRAWAVEDDYLFLCPRCKGAI
ncbi:hypothetical protein ACEPAI_2764 [Sanghuangporus weigelae]